MIDSPKWDKLYREKLGVDKFVTTHWENDLLTDELIYVQFNGQHSNGTFVEGVVGWVEFMKDNNGKFLHLNYVQSWELFECKIEGVINTN